MGLLPGLIQGGGNHIEALIHALQGFVRGRLAFVSPVLVAARRVHLDELLRTEKLHHLLLKFN
jgi:hypothetical protein